MKKSILFMALALMTASFASAQKLAHADINAILSVMPENNKINEDLKIYATGLSKRVEDQKAQLNAIIEQFNSVLKSGDTAKAVELQQQGLELDKALQKATAEAEQQLAQKRNELLQPVLQRVRNAMESVAKKKGYEYVLNSIDGSGTSIVLWGPEAADITRAVVDELGITLEDGSKTTTEEPAGKKKK